MLSNFWSVVNFLFRSVFPLQLQWGTDKAEAATPGTLVPGFWGCCQALLYLLTILHLIVIKKLLTENGIMQLHYYFITSLLYDSNLSNEKVPTGISCIFSITSFKLKVFSCY